MKKYKIPVTMTYRGYEIVEAETPEEALTKVGSGELQEDMEPTGVLVIDQEAIDEGEYVEEHYDCEICKDTGEVDTMESVYPGEPHQAPIGTQKCECRLSDPDDYDEQE